MFGCMSQKNTYRPGSFRVTTNGLREPPRAGGFRSTSKGMFAAPVGNIKLTAVGSELACPFDENPTRSPGAITASDFSPVPATDSGTHPIAFEVLAFEQSNQFPGLCVA